MKPLTINMVLPFPVTKPVGGAKIMYEYANRLAEKGHSVTIFHSIKRPFKKSSTPVWWKQLVFALRGVARPKWFSLHSNIKSVIVPAITDKYLPDADIVISTWWQMTYAVYALSPSKGKKFNLIQDHEIWTGQEDKVYESYRLPVHHLVIAKYLQQLVYEKSGTLPVHIPNAIDLQRFFISNPPEKRNPSSLIMLYSEEPRKGTTFGMEALEKVKKIHPQLEVVLFGVYPQPANLPPWITYFQRPSNLPELYNNAAIFFSPSNGEGWALPPAEAMACGCAVVCTNIGGHLDYANDGETALLVTPQQTDDMAEKIGRLINDNEERLRLAEAGAKLMSGTFSWENSVNMMNDAFGLTTGDRR